MKFKFHQVVPKSQKIIFEVQLGNVSRKRDSDSLLSCYVPSTWFGSHGSQAPSEKKHFVQTGRLFRLPLRLYESHKTPSTPMSRPCFYQAEWGLLSVFLIFFLESAPLFGRVPLILVFISAFCRGNSVRSKGENHVWLFWVQDPNPMAQNSLFFLASLF